MIARKPDIIETDLDHELILLDPSSQEMFSLNPTGRTLWRALPRSDAPALADVLVTVHGADPAAALADARAWLDTMRDTGLLLEPVDGPSA
jgi:hypothetical protein